jgi:hypothetical protein
MSTLKRGWNTNRSIAAAVVAVAGVGQTERRTKSNTLQCRNIINHTLGLHA